MSAPPHDPDASDIRSFQEALKSQDHAAAQSAFEHLKARRWEETVNSVQAIVLNKQDIDKVAEQAWERLYEELKSFDRTQPVQPFLLRVVRQVAEDWQDREDIALCRGTDKATADAAFTRLQQRWWARTVSVANRILSDQALAEDTAQDAWIKVYLALKAGAYDNTRPFRPFLMTVVIRAAYNHRPKGRRGEVVLPPPQWPEPIAQRRQLHARVHDCLAQLRGALEQQLMAAGLSAVFERLDTIPPVDNSALRDSLVALIETALPCVSLPQAKQLLSELRSKVVAGTPNPESERQAATALLRRTGMPPHDAQCPLYDWLEKFLEAVLPIPDDWQLRYNWWAYLVAMQALAFGETTAACALYRIQRPTFNGGQNSRWHRRMQPLAACVGKGAT